MNRTPGWLSGLLGWTPATTEKTRNKCKSIFDAPIGPNISDRSNGPSMQIAGTMFDILDIGKAEEGPDLDDHDSREPGSLLEKALEEDLARALRLADPDRTWIVERHRPVTDFDQFVHLSEIQIALNNNPTLRSTFGGDYQIETDVCVGVENPNDPFARPFLHAAISSKWTIRSDRVQNVRHEFATLVRNRRGRSPHLIAVTAEPLPTRLLSIARGTGEVDSVYHLLYEQLETAIEQLWAELSDEQKSAWTEMTEQKRLRPYSKLSTDLTLS